MVINTISVWQDNRPVTVIATTVPLTPATVNQKTVWYQTCIPCPISVKQVQPIHGRSSQNDQLEVTTMFD